MTMQYIGHMPVCDFLKIDIACKKAYTYVANEKTILPLVHI